VNIEIKYFYTQGKSWILKRMFFTIEIIFKDLLGNENQHGFLILRNTGNENLCGCQLLYIRFGGLFTWHFSGNWGNVQDCAT
jgi:hypothetical protein